MEWNPIVSENHDVPHAAFTLATRKSDPVETGFVQRSYLISGDLSKVGPIQGPCMEEGRQGQSAAHQWSKTFFQICLPHDLVLLQVEVL